MHLEKESFLAKSAEEADFKRTVSPNPKSHQVFKGGKKITRELRSPNLHSSVLGGSAATFCCDHANPTGQDT